MPHSPSLLALFLFLLSLFFRQYECLIGSFSSDIDAEKQFDDVLVARLESLQNLTHFKESIKNGEANSQFISTLFLDAPTSSPSQVFAIVLRYCYIYGNTKMAKMLIQNRDIDFKKELFREFQGQAQKQDILGGDSLSWFWIIPVWKVSLKTGNYGGLREMLNLIEEITPKPLRDSTPSNSWLSDAFEKSFSYATLSDPATLDSVKRLSRIFKFNFDLPNMLMEVLIDEISAKNDDYDGLLLSLLYLASRRVPFGERFFVSLLSNIVKDCQTRKFFHIESLIGKDLTSKWVASAMKTNVFVERLGDLMVTGTCYENYFIFERYGYDELVQSIVCETLSSKSVCNLRNLDFNELSISATVLELCPDDVQRLLHLESLDFTQDLIASLFSALNCSKEEPDDIIKLFESYRPGSPFNFEGQDVYNHLYDWTFRSPSNLNPSKVKNVLEMLEIFQAEDNVIATFLFAPMPTDSFSLFGFLPASIENHDFESMNLILDYILLKISSPSQFDWLWWTLEMAGRYARSWNDFNPNSAKTILARFILDHHGSDNPLLASTFMPYTIHTRLPDLSVIGEKVFDPSVMIQLEIPLFAWITHNYLRGRSETILEIIYCSDIKADHLIIFYFEFRNAGALSKKILYRLAEINPNRYSVGVTFLHLRKSSQIVESSLFHVLQQLKIDNPKDYKEYRRRFYMYLRAIRIFATNPGEMFREIVKASKISEIAVSILCHFYGTENETFLATIINHSNINGVDGGSKLLKALGKSKIVL